jgi:hypothetical protein
MSWTTTTTSTSGRPSRTAFDSLVESLTPEQREKLAENVDEVMAAAVSDAMDATAKGIVEQLKQDAPGMLKDRRAGQSEFEQRLFEHWGNAFDLSEMVLKVGYEAGEFFYDKHVPPDGQRDYVFEALRRLLARACRLPKRCWFN